MNIADATRPLTLPEALLLLAHDPCTGTLRVGRRGDRQLSMEKVAATNRALLAAGLLELIPWNRVVPYPRSATTTVLLYRFAPDDEPLPTAYTTELWNRLVPAINADLHHTFPKIVRMVQTAPVFGDAFQIPDQTRSVARELRAQSFFDSRGILLLRERFPGLRKMSGYVV